MLLLLIDNTAKLLKILRTWYLWSDLAFILKYLHFFLWEQSVFLHFLKHFHDNLSECMLGRVLNLRLLWSYNQSNKHIIRVFIIKYTSFPSILTAMNSYYGAHYLLKGSSLNLFNKNMLAKTTYRIFVIFALTKYPCKCNTEQFVEVASVNKHLIIWRWTFSSLSWTASLIESIIVSISLRLGSIAL